MTAISEAAPDADQEEAACAIGATAARRREAQGRQIMTRRKGEITGVGPKRKWPHHVTLPAEKVRSLVDDRLRFWCAASILCYVARIRRIFLG
jgi:hypothetical protein